MTQFTQKWNSLEIFFYIQKILYTLYLGNFLKNVVTNHMYDNICRIFALRMAVGLARWRSVYEVAVQISERSVVCQMWSLGK